MERQQKAVRPTGVERFFQDDKVIVSKTDLRGRLTYVNKTFMEISDYTEKELLGQPHSIIRHPAMPRCVFKLLWDRLEAGREVFAYVINLSKNGDHYWVLAHVTPSFDQEKRIVGYHSNRRVPNRVALNTTITPLYQQLLDEEQRHESTKTGLISGCALLQQLISGKGLDYDEIIFSLQSQAT